jgi:hypothetical protein
MSDEVHEQGEADVPEAADEFPPTGGPPMPTTPSGRYRATPLPPLPWTGGAPGGGNEIDELSPFAPPHPGPPAPPRPRTLPGFFILGFVAALALEPIALLIMGGLSPLAAGSPVFPPISLALLFAPLALFLVLLIEGRRRLSERMTSFGKGGLFGFFVPWVLIPLLVFGSCFFSGFPN